ncbi:hypothetical protein AQS8620_03275 [Aquimixticola soesokkakensis]|uniref:Response regulatory domain-containing protein n=1 Tax=Aquimixticola soesokkakensis TaxID=1519096 RepID=A0A1Y5TQ06_9RHOB|nr:response regulator [Aquimixticola soesokkakensis]SLN69427.1 hypothetical protein AQS8620_03275 [Aquimixticola soesokkakensis]
MSGMRTESPHQTTILAVDDDPVALTMIEALLQRLGYATQSARSGEDALERLGAGFEPSVILLDREMPGLNGIDVVRRLKESRDLARIPVIMVTGSDDPDEIREGIDAGVFYYLQKPTDARILSSVLTAALRQAEQSAMLMVDKKSTRGFELTEATKMTFRTMEDAAALAGFVANYFSDPDRCVDGIAALLFNAVEHGICGIGFEEKGRLLDDGRLRDEIRTRLSDKPDSHAVATVSRRADGVFLLVDDPGNGFDWREYTAIEISRSGASHGRGIARAKATAFDELKYNETGTRAIAFMRTSADFDW